MHFGQTATALTASDNPSTVSQPVTFTAVVTPTDGGGTVTFSADGSTIAGCGSLPLTFSYDGYQATCTTSSLLPGQHAIDASYTGDDLYDPSAQTIQQNVSVCHASADCVAPGAPLPWQALTLLQLVLNAINPILHQIGI
ncbi:MAG: Ig-like domain repeat protein [Acidimicrobiia bacterium]|nr:Ig-like domain repeat protein [Acidimicrobiia bacterium]